MHNGDTWCFRFQKNFELEDSPSPARTAENIFLQNENSFQLFYYFQESFKVRQSS